MILKHDGILSRKKFMPYTERCNVLMTSSVESYLPFVLITGTSGFLTTTVPAKSYNGKSIFSITMSSSNMSHQLGKANIPAEVFSRLVARPSSVPLFHTLTLHCSPTQRDLIDKYHSYLYAHHKVDKTIALMVQYELITTDKDNWLRRDICQYIQSCPTCQKMDATHKAIRASPFVLSPLQRPWNG